MKRGFRICDVKRGCRMCGVKKGSRIYGAKRGSRICGVNGRYRISWNGGDEIGFFGMNTIKMNLISLLR